jgi:purine-nucleoside phosphorylase
MADPMTAGEPGAAPILEFDPSPDAVIEPGRAMVRFDMPPRAVICWFRGAIDRLVGDLGGKAIGALESEMGSIDVQLVDWAGTPVAIALGGVGAALAGGWLDELVAQGGRAFVAAGGAGVLVPEVAMGHVIVPTAAIRDEGTSYHYLPASRLVEPTDAALAAVLATLDARDVPYVTGRTWTTDGYYRETREKVRRRVAEGCLTVEMEAAALFAVARFRGVELAQLLYAGDDLSGDTWDPRGWVRHESGRDLLLRLAIEAVVAIPVG